MNDLEFVRRCADGDRKNRDEFVNKYSRLIYNYIGSVLKQTNPILLNQENANDIFQEIFLSLINDNFKKLRSFKSKNGCSLASWLRQVTINHTIDYLRRLKPAVSLDEEIADDLSLKDIICDTAPHVLDGLSLQEKTGHLQECIAALNSEDKFFIEFHINRGVNLKIMRQVLKVSRGAIDMRKSRIIDRLRKCFKKKGFMLDL